MGYESFVAYSCMAIIAIVIIVMFHWIYTNSKKRAQLRKEFEMQRREIEDSIRREWARRGNSVANERCIPIIDNYDPMKIGARVAPRPKPKKAKKPKPEWWRFLTEESIGSLLEKRRQKKAEAEACKNDPWSSFDK